MFIYVGPMYQLNIYCTLTYQLINVPSVVTVSPGPELVAVDRHTHTHAHAYTYTQTDIHTYTQTHLHTYLYARS